MTVLNSFFLKDAGLTRDGFQLYADQLSTPLCAGTGFKRLARVLPFECKGIYVLEMAGCFSQTLPYSALAD